MKEIKKTFCGKDIRCFTIDGEPYFSVYDLCKVLDLSNSREQTKRLDKHGVRRTYVIDRLKRQQELVIINEPNLYQLIFKSKKKESQDFKKWVFEEVLPSIRKTGKYSIPEEVKKISTENRNLLTTEWQRHGIEKPYEYANLTIQEYKCLGVPDKRKKDLTRGETLLLSALESMEMLKLFNDDNINGYYDCKDSLIETTEQIKNITDKKERIEEAL